MKLQGSHFSLKYAVVILISSSASKDLEQLVLLSEIQATLIQL